LPFLSSGISKSIHLILGDRFRVKAIYNSLIVVLSVGESTDSRRENSIIASFTSTSRSDNHESMTYNSGVVKLKDLHQELFRAVHVLFLTCLLNFFY
jgi:hypothetical protein